MGRKNDIQSLCAKVQTLLQTTNGHVLPGSRETSISTIRAVYESAQSISRNSPTSAASDDLHGLIALLLHVVVAEQLPFDASVLASSSIVLLFPHVHPGCVDIHFRYFYLKVLGHHSNGIPTSSYSQATDNELCSICCPAQLKSIGVQSVLAFLHGFLKTSPDWMFKKQSAINIFDIIPLLISLVGSVDSTWLYQLFIIFELWCAKVKENLAPLLNSCNDKNSVCDAVELLLSVCSLNQNKPGSLFKVLSTHWECSVKGVPGLCISILSNMISIFDGITSGPPSGSSSSAQMLSGTGIVLDNVLSSGLWSSRATYATLQSLLLGHHLTAQQLVERCGEELCDGMCGGLRSSHLAICVTALYKLILASLTEEHWLCYFLEGFLVALTSDNKTTQHNLITLWLPVTVQRHPSVWQQLLAVCPNSDSGWRAKLAVLRAAQSALSPHIVCLGAQACAVRSECAAASHIPCFEGRTPGSVSCCDHKATAGNFIVHDGLKATSDNSSSSVGKLTPKKSVSGMSDVVNDDKHPPYTLSPSLVLCPATVWLQALDHPVPAVRADALALLCKPPKGFAISKPQAKLIQDFFIYNINIDCSIFRLSVVKSFKHLMARLRDALCKWTKPFKKHLDAGRNIPCDKINSELIVSSKLVVWFVRFLHHQLASDGNYQRRILSLQLYKEIILAFSSKACKGKRNSESIAIECATNFIYLHSTENEWCVQEDMFLASDFFGAPECSHCMDNSIPKFLSFSNCDCDCRNCRECILPISDFTLPHTIPLIISYLKHEMNDVRDESEELLSLLSEKAWFLYVRNTYFSISKASQSTHCSRNHERNLTPFSFVVQNFSNGENLKSSSNSSDITEASLEVLTSEGSDSVPAESYHASVVFAVLLRDAVALLDCPKMSLAESGALMVRVVVAALGRLQCARGVSLHQILLHLRMSPAALTSLSDCEDASLALLTALLAKAELDLAQARLNLLCAASSAPIYGTLLALAAVLGRTRGCSSSTRDAYEVFLPKVLLFCEEAVRFMLDNMALAAKEGAAVAPSFSEISESIERIILHCNLTSQSAEECARSGNDDGCDDACSSDECDDDECGAISSNHQLVLSCCWQTIRAACMLCSTVLCSPLVRVSAGAAIDDTTAASCVLPTIPACHTGSSTALPTESVLSGQEEAVLNLSIAVVKRAVDAVLIRTLTGTRHKGAIEAAKGCLGDTARVLLKHPSTYRILAELIDATLIRELDLADGDPSTSCRRSVTRRAAGLAMLTQAACVADYSVAGRSGQPALLLRTLDTLLQHASHDQQESELGDCRCSVVLHLLQGAVQQLQHCPRLDAIAAACTSAFTSTCWRCRNAGLQLFGGVVSRLVGQKKVAQDSSEYNSITAPQFIAAHTELARLILQLLRSAARAAVLESGRRSHKLDPTCLIKLNRSSLHSDDKCQQESLPQLAASFASGEMLTAEICSGNNWEIPPQRREDCSEFKDALHNDAGLEADHIGKSEVELSSAVLPVLCLLSRLSPGLQLCVDNFINVTVGFQECLLNLLASSIVNIRSLAAVSLLSLTPQAQQKSLLNRLLDRLHVGTSSSIEKSSETSIKSLNTVENGQYVTTNEKHGVLLVIKAYIERSTKVASSEGENTFDMVGSLAALYSSENECYVIRALACECLLLLNDKKSLWVDKRSLFRGHIHSPGYERFVELSLLYLLHAACSSSRGRTILFYLTSGSYSDAETVGNFWIESILQMKDSSIDDCDRKTAHVLVNLVLSNDMIEKSCLFLKLIRSLFDVKLTGRELLVGMHCGAVCNDGLLSILGGSLNAAAQRNLLILMSHLICSDSVKLSDDVVLLFCEYVVKFAGESCSEEFRLCSAKCVGLVLPCLMADVDAGALRYLKEHIVQVVCDLLYDEDPDVRDTAASEVFHVSSFHKHPLHANKALAFLLQYFAQQCILNSDSVLLESLWTCYADCAGKYACFKAKAKDGVKGYLFESDALNLYMETDVITQMLERTLLSTVQDPFCAQLLLSLCSASQIRVELSPSDPKVSKFSIHTRLHRFHSEVLLNIKNLTVQI